MLSTVVPWGAAFIKFVGDFALIIPASRLYLLRTPEIQFLFLSVRSRGSVDVPNLFRFRFIYFSHIGPMLSTTRNSSVIGDPFVSQFSRRLNVWNVTYVLPVRRFVLVMRCIQRYAHATKITSHNISGFDPINQ